MATWNTGTLPVKTQIQKLLDDVAFEAGGALIDILLPWANSIIMEIAHEINIHELLQVGGTVTVTTASYSGSMPTDYLKFDSRFLRARIGDTPIDIIGIDTLFDKDPNHDDTTTGTIPDYVAIKGTTLYTYPKNNSGSSWSIILDNYYKIPTAMSGDGDTPDIPESYLNNDMIVAGVCGKYGFPHLNEYDQAKFWYNRGKNPPGGRFFELLDLYKLHIDAKQHIWGDKGKYY